MTVVPGSTAAVVPCLEFEIWHLAMPAGASPSTWPVHIVVFRCLSSGG